MLNHSLCEVHYCWSGSDSAGGIAVEPLSGSIGTKCIMLQYLEGLNLNIEFHQLLAPNLRNTEYIIAIDHIEFDRWE